MRALILIFFLMIASGQVFAEKTSDNLLSPSLTNCIKEAKKNRYVTDVEAQLSRCLEKHPPQTAQQCFQASHVFQFSQNSDEFRWGCLRDYNKKLSVKGCDRIASNISNPALQSRALYYCLNEIKATPTVKECLQLSKKLYPSDSLESLKHSCETESF